MSHSIHFSHSQYSVSDPSWRAGLEEIIEQDMASIDFRLLPSNKLNLDHKVRRDDLTKLPLDIIYLIYTHLTAKDAFALMEASFHASAATRNNGFWKQFIKRAILPWFWEFELFVFDKLTDDTNYKRLYLWLDAITEPRFGMDDGSYLRIANRRRIWKVCEQLAERYWRDAAKPSAANIDEPGRSVLDESICDYMPVTASLQSDGGRIQSTLWLHSWDELNPDLAVFESFWNTDGMLVGLAVDLGNGRRLLGQGESNDQGIVRQSATIPPGHWIKGFVLHIGGEIPRVGDEAIRALTVSSLVDELPIIKPLPRRCKVRHLNRTERRLTLPSVTDKHTDNTNIRVIIRTGQSSTSPHSMRSFTKPEFSHHRLSSLRSSCPSTNIAREKPRPPTLSPDQQRRHIAPRSHTPPRARITTIIVSMSLAVWR